MFLDLHKFQLKVIIIKCKTGDDFDLSNILYDLKNYESEIVPGSQSKFVVILISFSEKEKPNLNKKPQSPHSSEKI